MVTLFRIIKLYPLDMQAMDSVAYMKNDKAVVTLHFIHLVYSRLHSIHTSIYGYKELLKHLYFANTLRKFLLHTCPSAVTSQMTFSSTSQAVVLNQKHFWVTGPQAFRYLFVFKNTGWMYPVSIISDILFEAKLELLITHWLMHFIMQVFIFVFS